MELLKGFDDIACIPFAKDVGRRKIYSAFIPRCLNYHSLWNFLRDWESFDCYATRISYFFL